MQLLAAAWVQRGILSPTSACQSMLLAMGHPGAWFQTANPAAQLGVGDEGQSATAGDLSVVLAGKIINRVELGHPGAASNDGPNDAELLLQLWRLHGPDGLGRVLGSLAALLFDGARGELIAWRSAGSERQLFLAGRPGLILAATLPDGLFAHPDLPKQLDFASAAAWAAGIPSQSWASMFAGVRRVLPGQALSLRPDREPQERWRWQPRRTRRTFGTLQDAADELRTTFDRAVADALPPPGQVCAAHLSSGRDSSAVVASAGLQLGERGDRLLALTGVPAADTSALPTRGRIADESELAGRTANMFANVDHLICRPPAGASLEQLSALHKTTVQPAGNLSNLPWTAATFAAAKANGATTFLQGTAGNFTISAGSRDYLNDLVADEGWRSGLAAATRSAGLAPMAWRNVLHVLVGPRLPPSIYFAAMRAVSRLDSEDGRFPSLRQPFRSEAEQQVRAASPELQPESSGFDWRLRLLANHDHADIFHPGHYGFELRDPTNDPRLVELTLSMPPAYLLPTPEDPRPVYAAAFGDRLPTEVVQGRRRGYQGADWAAQFPVEEVHARMEKLLDHPLNAELFDRDYVLTEIRRRPDDPWTLTTWPVIRLHRMMLLSALSVADWIAVHFPA